VLKVAEHRASVEAERVWHHVSGLLRARRKGGLAEMIGGRGGDDYGVRIDGWRPDSLEIFVLLWSAAAALNELAGICHKSWMILNREVNEGNIEWSTPVNSGVADELGISVEEAKAYYAAGVEWMHAELAGHQFGEEWWKVLDAGITKGSLR
jgi:hypothetical protein